MKRIFPLLMILLAVSLFSCQKNSDPAAENDEVLKQATIETGICFNFVYPITVTFRDGSTAEINSDQQYRRVMASCGTQRCFDFVYPLSVVFRGGNTVAVANDQQMRRVYASCD